LFSARNLSYACDEVRVRNEGREAVAASWTAIVRPLRGSGSVIASIGLAARLSINSFRGVMPL